MKFELKVVVTTKRDQFVYSRFSQNMSVHGNWFRAWLHELGPGSRAALLCQDDFQPGEPGRLMADARAMNHGRPEPAWFWCDEGLMSRAGPVNAITWKISARLAGISAPWYRDLG